MDLELDLEGTTGIFLFLFLPNSNDAIEQRIRYAEMNDKILTRIQRSRNAKIPAYAGTGQCSRNAKIPAYAGTGLYFLTCPTNI